MPVCCDSPHQVLCCFTPVWMSVRVHRPTPFLIEFACFYHTINNVCTLVPFYCSTETYAVNDPDKYIHGSTNEILIQISISLQGKTLRFSSCLAFDDKGVKPNSHQLSDKGGIIRDVCS